MGEATERQRVTTNLSFDIEKDMEKYPRDLLRSFISGDVRTFLGETDCYEESAIELNLGLSLGGRFGVDKTPRKLKRSSSVLASFPFENSMVAETEVEPENYTVGLSRTTSLLAEMEEEWRKRKEIQSLRRMEAKRRRCEKQSCKVANSDQTASFETERWVTASKSGFFQRHLVSSNPQVYVDSNVVVNGGSKGGSASSLGSSNNYGDERNTKIMSGSEKPISNEKETEKQVSREDSIDRKGKGMATATGLIDMPCVSTKGDGPTGRRVDGILYKYGKREEVRIMCICHGSFLTPAEFVKHGGGGVVDHPLRHIVVNTSSSTF